MGADDGREQHADGDGAPGQAAAPPSEPPRTWCPRCPHARPSDQRELACNLVRIPPLPL